MKTIVDRTEYFRKHYQANKEEMKAKAKERYAANKQPNGRNRGRPRKVPAEQAEKAAETDNNVVATPKEEDTAASYKDV